MGVKKSNDQKERGMGCHLSTLDTIIRSPKTCVKRKKIFFSRFFIERVRFSHFVSNLNRSSSDLSENTEVKYFTKREKVIHFRVVFAQQFL
jgi:hypothetical protein